MEYAPDMTACEAITVASVASTTAGIIHLSANPQRRIEPQLRSHILGGDFIFQPHDGALPGFFIACNAFTAFNSQQIEFLFEWSLLGKIPTQGLRKARNQALHRKSKDLPIPRGWRLTQGREDDIRVFLPTAGKQGFQCPRVPPG